MPDYEPRDHDYYAASYEPDRDYGAYLDRAEEFADAGGCSMADAHAGQPCDFVGGACITPTYGADHQPTRVRVDRREVTRKAMEDTGRALGERRDV